MPPAPLLTHPWYFINGCGCRRQALFALLAAGTLWSASISAPAAVLWQRPDSTLVQNHSVEVLREALALRDGSAREILYFKVRVNPLSDVLTKSKEGGSFQAGLVFRREGDQKLGLEMPGLHRATARIAGASSFRARSPAN